MEWSVSDGPGRYKPTLQDRDGSVSVASMTIDGNEIQLPELSVESEGKPGRAIVTIDGSRRVAHVARSGDTWWVHIDGRAHEVTLHEQGYTLMMRRLYKLLLEDWDEDDAQAGFVCHSEMANEPSAA